MQEYSVNFVGMMPQRYHRRCTVCDTRHVSSIAPTCALYGPSLPIEGTRWLYPSPNINPLRRFTLRNTAPSKTPARGSIKLNQCLARVMPV